MPRYHFSDFVLSPRRRLLLRNGRELPIIPRYLDLLVFLIERRHEAVHRRAIFDRVWSDVIVSDSALSQAIRTIRRTLGDDPREPRFIRTVSRHGYQFVFPGVIEEDDATAPPAEPGSEPIHEPPGDTLSDPYEPLLERITRSPANPADEEDQREAAELLHALGTAEALRRLDARPGHSVARALLRDTRPEIPGAGPVPLVARRDFSGMALVAAAGAATLALVRLRLRRAARVAAGRWAGASAGGGLAGIVAGAAGALVLVIVPGSTASPSVVPALALVGGCCGAAGGAGVGAGLSGAEALARSHRGVALVCGAAAGGGLVGLAVQWLARWTLAALVGIDVAIGGGIEGVIIGAGAGVGYGWATRAQEGLAAPRGRRRLMVALLTAAGCGVAALALTASGRPLAGGTIHLIAQASQGSQVLLTQLARLIGEPDFGLLTSVIIGTGEGILFGLGVALGLTRRP